MNISLPNRYLFSNPLKGSPALIYFDQNRISCSFRFSFYIPGIAILYVRGNPFSYPRKRFLTIEMQVCIKGVNLPTEIHLRSNQSRKIGLNVTLQLSIQFKYGGIK